MLERNLRILYRAFELFGRGRIDALVPDRLRKEIRG